MIKFYKTYPFVKFEKVIDFSRESHIGYFQGYYMKPKEISSLRNIPLYVMKLEEVTTIYILATSASDWVRENLVYNLNDSVINLEEDFMYSFDLVRVIPAGGSPGYDSFLRVTLKQVPENAKRYSIEEEYDNQ